MYYRIKNWLDARAVAVKMERDDMDGTVADRIREIAETLDSNYGALRSVHADGGYILFFPTREIYEELIEPLEELYNLEAGKREYLDYIGRDGLWCEELYLFTEEALVLIYPKE